jgi:hypothetical protein
MYCCKGYPGYCGRDLPNREKLKDISISLNHQVPTKNGTDACQVPFFVYNEVCLRYVVRNHQLRTVRRVCGIATVQAEIVGNRIVVVIQLEAQTDLCQAGTCHHLWVDSIKIKEKHFGTQHWVNNCDCEFI